MNKLSVITRNLLFSAIVIVSVAFFTGCATQDFQSDVQTQAKPWTNKEFKNNPADFHFVIVSDRNGGCRKGIFSLAIDKVNLLQPEFVLSIGDFINGGTNDVEKLTAEWDEFNQIVDKLQMRFFYVPGNHDNGSPVMAKLWEEKLGRRYYSFKYKNVLFLCLDTQDIQNQADKKYPGQGLTDEQIDWAKKVIAENKGVRWTFVFMHQPLWLYDDSALAKNPDKKPGRGTGLSQIEDALANRDYSVFAGHVHHYTKTVRNKRNYFTLATTGGASPLKGPQVGQFDGLAWITMTPDGPIMANLLIDGIMDDDVTKKPE